MHKGFILLNCDLGAEEYIVDELNQMQDVSNAYLTFGAYDVIAEIQTEDQDGFEKNYTEFVDLADIVGEGERSRTRERPTIDKVIES